MASPTTTAESYIPAVASTPEERSAALADLLSMYGMLHDLYERAGGAEQWHRKEQETWNESALA
jgi:hypothetical protein